MSTKKAILTLAALTVSVMLVTALDTPRAFAKDNMQGTIVSENSVACSTWFFRRHQKRSSSGRKPGLWVMDPEPSKCSAIA